jgi:hypothetical protein
MIYKSLKFVMVIGFLMTCISCRKSPFLFRETEEGIELSENSSLVFFYQRKPKTLTGQYVCNNYLHPLYGLNGEILTEEFPADHPYHRGIFWTWHQLYVDTTSLGDGWINEGISQEVVSARTETGNDYAKIFLNVDWKSSTYMPGKPFMNESTVITVHEIDNDLRKIDFEIKLQPLVDGLQVGGSADAKGYGGLCARIKLPDDLIFTSETGRVTPQELQIKAGPWMDFSGTFQSGSGVSGLAMLCSPSNPGFPQPWILRQKTSMQNVAWPGQNRIEIPRDKPVTLKYRIFIHKGNAEGVNLPGLQDEYGK